MRQSLDICLLILAAAVTASCGDALSPESALGDWALVSVNGDPVPGLVTLTSGQSCDYDHDTLTLISVTETRLDGFAGRFENDYRLRCDGEDAWRERLLTGTYDLNTDTELLVISVADRHSWEFAIDGTAMMLQRHGLHADGGIEWNSLENVLLYRKQ